MKRATYLLSLIWLLPIVASLSALAPMPGWGFLAVRCVVFGGALLLIAFTLIETNVKPSEPVWAIAFMGLAVVFNPIRPFHLGRPLWQFTDVATAAVFLAHMVYPLRSI